MASQQHLKHRNRELARYLLNSANARDIAPLPAVKQHSRRATCAASLRDYLETYHAKTFPLPFSSNHIEFISRLETVIKTGGLISIAMPRGTGKTSISDFASEWAVLNNWRRFVLLISSTATEAERNMNAIKTSLLSNDLLLEDYPEVCYPIRKMEGRAITAAGQTFYGRQTRIKWGSRKIKLPTVYGSESSGNAIACYGITSSIRGVNEDMPDGSLIRPDFLMLDDLQKDDLAVNPARVARLEEIVNSTLLGLSASDKTIASVMTCTVITDGDLADRFLSHDIYPQWSGLRFKMLPQMPNRMDMWREYKGILMESPDEATAFYKAHRKEMNIGAQVAWPEAYDPNESVDALQHAMTKWARNERSFQSEYQNEPIKSSGSNIQVPARVISGRLNGLSRYELPPDTVKVTAFIDVHQDILYYCVCAVDVHFTASIIDYGTLPEQNRNYFEKSETGLDTLQQSFGGDVNSAMQQGLEMISHFLLNQEYFEDNGSAGRRVDALFIDGRFRPEVVAAAMAAVKSPRVHACRGVGIRSTSKPMAQWPHKNARHFGHHWLEEKIPGARFRSVLTDTNYWKTRVHESFGLYPGERGSLTLWGNDKTRHRMYSDHMNAETVKLVSSNGNSVFEWFEKPAQFDNHYFDCTVGCLVAASALGIRIDGQEE